MQLDSTSPRIHSSCFTLHSRVLDHITSFVFGDGEEHNLISLGHFVSFKTHWDKRSLYSAHPSCCDCQPVSQVSLEILTPVYHTHTILTDDLANTAICIEDI